MNQVRLPKKLRKRAKREVEIFGQLFSDTAMEIAALGFDVHAYELALQDRFTLSQSTTIGS